MPMLTRDDFMSRIQERIGDDETPEALAFIADMADTFDGLSDTSQVTALQTELDELRKEYKARFFSGGQPNPQPQKRGAEEIQFKDLFKEV